MFKLIRVGRVFSPQQTKAVEILTAAGQILAVGNRLQDQLPTAAEVEVFDAGPDSTAVPGLIDNHVHITGGGGEGGYHTRVPEITLSNITACGVTTVIGVLGTDDVTRHLESLLAKARGLENEGVSAYILTGSYALPPPTLTGSVKRDILLIDKVIGVGEIAISDHRASKAGFQALRDAAAGCRLGGLLSGKGGVLQLHVGHDPEGLAPARRLVEERIIPMHQLLPTHVNRSRALFDEALQYLEMGGSIDLTAFGFPNNSAVTAKEALEEIVSKNLPLDRVTISSDSNGSLPEVDSDGRIVGLRQAKMSVMLDELRHLLRAERLSWPQVLAPVTVNPAGIYGLARKGRIEPGLDADITVFSGRELQVCHVLAQGRTMIKDGQIRTWGTFEEVRDGIE